MAGVVTILSVVYFAGGLLFAPFVRFVFTQPLMFLGLFALVALSVVWLGKKTEKDRDTPEESG